MPPISSCGFLGVTRYGGLNGLFRARAPEPGGGGVKFKEMNSFSTAEAAARWYDATVLEMDRNAFVTFNLLARRRRWARAAYPVSPCTTPLRCRLRRPQAHEL